MSKLDIFLLTGIVLNMVITAWVNLEDPYGFWHRKDEPERWPIAGVLFIICLFPWIVVAVFIYDFIHSKKR